MKFEPQGGELQASWGDEPADPSPPQHGAPESEENPWQDLVESPAMPTPDADAAQAPDAARAPVRGGMQDEWGPRPGEVWGEMLYCVGCEQFMAPEAFHKSMQKWTLSARRCIVCRDADAAQAPDAVDVEWRPRPGEKHNEILYCVACEQYMAPNAFHKSMQKMTLPARTCIACRNAEWETPLQPPAQDITPPE